MLLKRQRAKWTSGEDAKLRELAVSGSHVRTIALRLRRSESSIKKRARDIGVEVRQPPRSKFRVDELAKEFASLGK